jgi:hypothetical protein
MSDRWTLFDGMCRSSDVLRHPAIHRVLTTWLLPIPTPCRWQWYRRWQGGHWERWYIETLWADLWLDVDHCTRGTRLRPPLGRGTPTCEDWP